MLKHRHQGRAVAEALDSFRAVSLTGARQTGKTTLVRQLCLQRDMAYVSLEEPLARAAARADADAWLTQFPGPLAIDEVQHAPDLLRAIKRRVDTSNHRGQFLLTGSALWLSMKAIGETLAGRVALLELWPFSLAEAEERQPAPLETLLAPELDPRALSELSPHPGHGDMAWAQEAILRGGYPEPASFPRPETRALWVESYLNTYLQRDVLDLVRIEHADLFVRLIRLLASRTAQILNISSLARELGLPQPTVARYVDWLTITYQRFALPPYTANVGKRFVKAPKTYWTDTGMVAGLLGWRTWNDVRNAGADGPLLETWVAAELRKWSSIVDRRPMYFWRTHGGGEVDFLFERDGQIIGIEVKAGHRVTRHELRGLIECRDALGDRFRRGIVLYAGTDVVPLGDRLVAVPLAFLRGA